MEQNNVSRINQINIKKAWYIVGFADGEGSFNLSWRKRDDYLIGWKVSPVFNISQKEKTILSIIKSHLKCGTIRFRNDAVWVYEVNNKNALIEKIIPFFQKFRFLSEKKKRDFARFIKIVKIVYQGHKTKTYDDVTALLKLISDIEHKHSRKYTDQEILDRASDFWLKNKSKIEDANMKHS